MSYVNKEAIREQVNRISDTNPMKFLIRNLVTRITRIRERKPTVNLIEIRNVFFDHLQNIKDDKAKTEFFIETINKHFSEIVPADMVISIELFEEWKEIKQKRREGYSDFILSEEPPLREMGGETKRPMSSAMAISHPPLMRQASISDGNDPWEDIFSRIFTTDQVGETGGENVTALLNRKHQLGTPLYQQRDFYQQNVIDAGNLAALKRYEREGRKPRKPYRRGGKTRKRKKTRRRKYKKRRRKRTKRKRRIKRKKNKLFR